MADDGPVRHNPTTLSAPDAPDLRRRPLTLLDKLGYGVGATVDGVVHNILNFFLLFYVTAVCGLSGSLAGLALSLGLAVDAVADPMIGVLSDGWRSRLGRRLPFMIVGAPAAAAGLILIFSAPQGLGQAGMFAFILGASLLVRIGMSTFVLPFGALGAELSDDYAERSSIAAWRFALSMIAALVVVSAGFGVFLKGPQGLLSRSAYTAFAASAAGLMLLGASTAIWRGLALRRRAHAEGIAASGGLTALAAGIREAVRNPSFNVLVVSTLLLFVGQGVMLALGLHANTYFWGLDETQIQVANLSLFVGLLIGAPIFGSLLGRIEKRTLLVSSLLVLALIQAVPPSFRLVGWLPRDGATLTAIVSTALFLAGLCLCAAAISVASMLADAADEHQFMFGTRREGLYFAGWTFAAKAAGGVGSLVSGFVLQLSGFPSNLASAHVILADRTTMAIGAAYGPGAALFSLAGALTMLFYRLDRKRHAEILQHLRPTTQSETAPVATAADRVASRGSTGTPSKAGVWHHIS